MRRPLPATLRNTDRWANQEKEISLPPQPVWVPRHRSENRSRFTFAVLQLSLWFWLSGALKLSLSGKSCGDDWNWFLSFQIAKATATLVQGKRKQIGGPPIASQAATRRALFRITVRTCVVAISRRLLAQSLLRQKSRAVGIRPDGK